MFLKTKSTYALHWGWHRISLCVLGVAFTLAEFRHWKPNEVVNRTNLQNSKNNPARTETTGALGVGHSPVKSFEEEVPRAVWVGTRALETTLQCLVWWFSFYVWLVLERRSASSVPPVLGAITNGFREKHHHIAGGGGCLGLRILISESRFKKHKDEECDLWIQVGTNLSFVIHSRPQTRHFVSLCLCSFTRKMRVLIVLLPTQTCRQHGRISDTYNTQSSVQCGIDAS